MSPDKQEQQQDSSDDKPLATACCRSAHPKNDGHASGHQEQCAAHEVADRPIHFSRELHSDERNGQQQRRDGYYDRQRPNQRMSGHMRPTPHFSRGGLMIGQAAVGCKSWLGGEHAGRDLPLPGEVVTVGDVTSNPVNVYSREACVREHLSRLLFSPHRPQSRAVLPERHARAVHGADAVQRGAERV